MSERAPAPARQRDWWARPRVVLPLVGAFVVLLALLTPQPSLGRMGDPRLSTHLAGSLGARALAETAERLGYVVVRRDSVGAPPPASSRGRSIHAVLAPRAAITGAEAHAYLDAVRAGDGLLLVFDDRNALSDSLGLWRTPGGTLRPPADSAACRHRDFTPSLWPDGKVHLYGLRWLRGAPADRVVLASLQPDPGRSVVPGEAAAGFVLGAGRVVVIPDPDLLRNDVLRRCQWGADVLAVGILEWLRAGGAQPRDSIVVDEYHHGFGPSASALGTTSRFLRLHPVGRSILAICLAGLVLLAALAPRPLPPPDVERVERRDPLEQVDALAHAYEQVGATRTVVSRLLRGMRGRAERGSPASRQRPDDAFLDGALSVDPTRADDVALIRRALREPIASHDLPHVGAALQRLEASLTTTDA